MNTLDPTHDEGYTSVIEQIWVEIRRVITCVVPENNLANIILDYAEIDDFYVFSRVLEIHVPGVAALTNWVHTYNIYLGSAWNSISGSRVRTGYIYVITTGMTSHLEIKKMRFNIDLHKMFLDIQARNYIGIATHMKFML